MKPEVLRAMLNAGASAEMLVAAVEASYKADEERRLYERERKRKQRMSLGQSGTAGDKEKVSHTLPKENYPSVSPTEKHLPCEPLFDEFWLVYPRKVAKGAARKAFRHANARASSAEIIAGARRYADSKPDPQFTAHPASWLNADRWLDEPSKPSATMLSGPWKPFKPEIPDPEKPPAEIREQQLAKLRDRA